MLQAKIGIKYKYFPLQKLGDSVIIITRQDKEKVLFHNNKELVEETDEGKK